MANKTLFSSIKSKFTRTDTVNEAGGCVRYRCQQLSGTLITDLVDDVVDR